VATSFVAHQDFERAKSRAFWRKVASWITGESNELLPFNEVRRLPFEGQRYVGLQSVPLEKIVGSVGRYKDFDRAFLPRTEGTRYRWENIDKAMEAGVALPPVELYKVGDVYFVKDGNHRVSVARTREWPSIDAYVTEVDVPLEITPETEIDALLRKQEQAAFLHQTEIHKVRPDVEIELTEPGQYPKLLEHIAVHRWHLGEEHNEEVSYREAVASWVDNVYLPLVEIIREQGVLEEFPDRTAADLYLWVSEHRAELAERLGWAVDAKSVASELAEQYGRSQRGVLGWGQRLLKAVTPEELETGSRPGAWREERAEREGERLFVDVLVAISGEPGGWVALNQALDVARREGGYLHGLYVVPDEDAREAEETQAIRDEFDRRCQDAGVPGECIIDVGEVVPSIWEYGRWADLVVASLLHPPEPHPLAKWGAGFRNLLYRASSPVLAVPEIGAQTMDRALLAYDGSPKADEALFTAAHLAHRWGLSLVVLSVTESGGEQSADALDHAMDYLSQYEVEAIRVEESCESVGGGILLTAEAYDAGLIIMGSYGFSPLLEVVLGSAVDRVLHDARRPVLICR
jgi:nucleotide-binding universal stress UspA family protein